MSTSGAATNRLVVVISPVTTAYNEEANLFAARFAELGLTSFGHTPAQATRRLKSLFNTFIHAHRELGVLAETLDKFGVEWYWADDYPDGKPEYEDTNKGTQWVAVPPGPHPNPVYQPAANNHMAMAA